MNFNECERLERRTRECERQSTGDSVRALFVLISTLGSSERGAASSANGAAHNGNIHDDDTIEFAKQRKRANIEFTTFCAHFGIVFSKVAETVRRER